MAIETVGRVCIVAGELAIAAFQVLADLARRVFEAVVEFFTGVVNSISLFLDECCADEAPVNWDEPFQIQPDANIDNSPVNLDALRQVLRRGYGNPVISSRMGAADFTALCQDYPITLRIVKDGIILRNVQIQEIQEKQAILDAEKARVRGEEGEGAAARVKAEVDFPQERINIGNWARQWANARTIRIDPAHPYFEIFQRAFELKNQIQDGDGADGDYRTYALPQEGYVNGPYFAYLIKSLMGFQELSREENRALMRKLDTHLPIFENNPAYTFARAISKIYCYPTSRDWGGVEMDVRDKLQIGIPAPMNAFRAAHERNQTLNFFQNAFNRGNICFDIRVEGFQRYIFNLAHPHIEDFSPQLEQAQTTAAKIFEYYRVFANTEMFRLANELQPGNPEPIYQQLKMGGGNRALLYAQYCTKARFEQYLIENGSPIKELQGAAGVMPPVIPFQADWNGWIPNHFKRVPLAALPAHLRAPDAIVGVQDPNPFVATVETRGNLHGQIQYHLVFSRNRPAHHQIHNPIIDYPHAWMGTDSAVIQPDILPPWRRHYGATVLIRDPAIYRVRVHAVDGDIAILDFRGDPIPRARWEAVLNDDEYWMP